MPAVYMDSHATTRVDARVLEAMLPFFGDKMGNAASRSHVFGWEAAQAVETARASVARLLGATTAREIVFTCGATESDNLALKGAARLVRERAGRDGIVCSAVEHRAVIDTCRRLQGEGFRVTWLGVEPDGRVNPTQVARAIDERTAMVTLMLANNEVGSVQPVAEVGRVTRGRGVLLHVDAAQALGLVPFDVERMNVDLASVSAHKMYGPKGVGALYVRRANPRVRLIAEMDGGGHERGMRSGTLNVPGIVGLGRAAELMMEEGAALAEQERRLRDGLCDRLLSALGETHVHGAAATHRHPGNLNISFDRVESEALMIALKDDVAVSSGSACTSASLEPSYVLRAMGVDADRAHASIRFGLGRFNTEADVERVAGRVIEEVRRLRALDPPSRGAGA